MCIPALALPKLLPPRTETWCGPDLAGLRLDLADTEHVLAACRTPQQRPSPGLGGPPVAISWVCWAYLLAGLLECELDVRQHVCREPELRGEALL